MQAGASLTRSSPPPRSTPPPARAPARSPAGPVSLPKPTARPVSARASGGSDKAIITEAANKYGINPAILWGLYGTETAFGKNVTTSSAGAVGPFQFEPGTAAAMGVNPYDFKSAAYGAARYLAQYRSRGVGGMLSAYNAGPAGGYQAGYVESTLNNAKSYGSAAGSIPAISSSSSGGGVASPVSVRSAVARSMGLPPGVTTQAGGSEVRPNPKAGGLELLAAEYRGSDPLLAQILEAKAGEGTIVPTGAGRAGAGVASTAAGTPTTGGEAQALAEAPPQLQKPAKAPVKTDLAKAKERYGTGNGGAFPIPGPGETSKGLEADLEPVAEHPSGKVVRHGSRGVPLYFPNQKKGRR